MQFSVAFVAAALASLAVAVPHIDPNSIQAMFTYPNGSTTDFITIPDRLQWFPIGSTDPVSAITLHPIQGKNVRCNFIDPDRATVATPALTHQDTIEINPAKTVAYSQCESS